MNSPEEPQVIIDYACGNGSALVFLRKAFPSARLIGLDGSTKMLRLAARALQDVHLIRTPLPNFRLRLPKADIVLFTFPNMNYFVPPLRKATARNKLVAEKLTALEEDRKARGSRAVRELLKTRVIAENIRSLLRNDGLWIKTEYSCIPRQEMTDLDHWKHLFTEAAFCYSIRKKMFRDKFEFLHSEYFRSRVIMDVYDQTADPTDRNGGYFISSFRAL